MTEPLAPTPIAEATEYEPGGDMVQGTVVAHIETPEEIEANPIEEAEPVSEPTEPYKSQHAKVLRFEVSIGRNDDDRTLEEFEQDVRKALMGDISAYGLPPNNITMTGGYYIIDGKVCLTADYDHATKNRKPGTHPPSWAGGPVESSGKSSVTYDTPETVAVKAKGAAAVAALAKNMNREVKAKS